MFAFPQAEFDVKSTKKYAGAKAARNEKVSGMFMLTKRKKKMRTCTYYIPTLFFKIPKHNLQPLYTFSQTKIAAEEMVLLDSETRARRKARLREFYQQQEEMYRTNPLPPSLSHLSSLYLYLFIYF
jgi:hypothetical protein